MKIADLNQLKISTLLPSPKGVALALLEACRQEDISINEITKLIQTDPALAGRLIQRANATKQTTRAISSIAEAVSHVGLNAVKQLAMGFSLIDQYSKDPSNGFDYQEFWSHSLLMAIAVQKLSKTTQASSSEDLFSCGLMMRIGCLALASIYPDQYSQLIQQQSRGIPLQQLEQQYLQTDHNELTAAMLINFGFPTIFVEPIYYHETPENSGFSEGSRPYQILHQLYLAKQIADFALTKESERSQCISELLLLGGKIGLDTETFGDFIDQIMQEWHIWGKILKITAKEQLPSFHKMMSAAAPRPEDATNASSLRVLLVEDDPTNLILSKELLSNVLGHTVYTANDGQQALALAMEVSPHIVITDWMMPIMNGLELTKSLRATEWGQNLYVIMLTSIEDEEEVIKAFNAGVDDYVTKPINIRAFRARLRAAWHYRQLQESWERDREQLKRFAAELAVTNRKLEYYALTDMLTELPNRRSGMETLSETWSIANRSGQLMVIMLIDIDHFKSINDNYGHSIGDKVLKEVSSIIRKTARKGDTFCRMGGEEFLVVCQLGNADVKSSILFAERLRHQISQQQISIGEIHIRITISIGVALKEINMKNEDHLVIAADKALYAAKNAGRNRVYLALKDKLLATPPPPSTKKVDPPADKKK
ncbi:diguanylate cyclase [Nitrosomonas ureae]|uniref:diguanylate cyclase n=1 Tax=Nitrosomonas ureae TaxID=44577 RepID=A0A286A5G0_9PROT|nr:diguanylate cyclase [Nitrosomonas ureae]SOD17110.1 response regulator receiver modulated diguanylate cyclase [Nitrosomonas ureae]